MENKFKIGDKVLCTYKGADCWYSEGEVYTITSPGFKDDDAKGLAYNIQGEPINVWIDSAHFELLETSGNSYTTKHYDTYYQLTEKDIEEGNIRVDAYWVAKQWKIGSRDDSGALFHNLKTIARFGEKNSIEREIKALYNQTKALARVYGVELDE